MTESVATDCSTILDSIYLHLNVLDGEGSGQNLTWHQIEVCKLICMYHTTMLPHDIDLSKFKMFDHNNTDYTWTKYVASSASL
jgi:hypothetical protein